MEDGRWKMEERKFVARAGPVNDVPAMNITIHQATAHSTNTDCYPSTQLYTYRLCHGDTSFVDA